MSELKEFFDGSDESFFQMIKHNLTPIDLFIINKLNNGVSLNNIEKLVEKEFNLRGSKKFIEDSIKNLVSDNDPKKKTVQGFHPQYIIDPTKFYDYIFLIFIKAHLTPLEHKTMNLGTQDIYETILDINNKPFFNKPIKLFLTVSPGNKYDFFGLVFENNLKRFHTFREYLLKEGIADSFEIIPINHSGGFVNNMNIAPDYYELKSYLIHYRDRINLMIDRLTEKEIVATKTTRYFEDNEYALIVKTGKDKGIIYPVDKQALKIGRYYDNDIIVKDISVSRRHARISKIGNKYLFEDQSSNGSYINDKFINHDEREINKGDFITIGKIKYQFQRLSSNDS